MFPVKKRPNVIPISLEIEAEYLKSILKDNDIPSVFVSYYDTAYAGLFQSQNGWGHVEVPMDHAEEVKRLYAELKQSSTNPEEPAPG